MENSIIKKYAEEKITKLIETINNLENRLDNEYEELDTIDIMFSYEELKEQSAEIIKILK